MKRCFKCGVEKPLTEFYRHSRMLDGTLNKCKGCTKADAMARYNEKVFDKGWVEKERERGREKYHRFKYKPKPETKRKSIANYSARFPEKVACKSSITGKRPKGVQYHHWSYKEEHRRDVIQIGAREHATLHRFLIYVPEERVYKAKSGEILDTREKHERFIKALFDGQET